MKKLNIFMTAFFLLVTISIFAMSCQLQLPYGGPYCANPTTGVSFVTIQLTLNPNANMCVGNFAVSIQRKLPSVNTWTALTLADYNGAPMPNISNASTYNYTAQVKQLENTTYEYRAVTTYDPTGPVGSCTTIAGESCTTTDLVITTVAPARVNFKINNLTINNTTAIQVCDLGAVDLTNIVATGNTTGYQYRIGSSKNGSAIIWNPWNTGLPPATTSIKRLLGINHGTNLSGNYVIYMEVTNLCGSTTQYSGLMNILTGNLSLSLNACSDPNCLNGGTNISTNTTCATPLTTFCNLNPTLSAANSNITLLAGTWTCKLEELPNSCTGSPVLVFSKPTASLTNISSLSNISLNSFATLYGGKTFPYITNNSATKKWKFTLTVTNFCGTATFVCYLQNINSACKTSGSSENEVFDNIPMLENIKDGWDFFPNPANKDVTVIYDVNSDTPHLIKVYDLTGKLQNVQVKEVSISESIIDISSLSKGVYIIEKSGDTKTTKKLIVE